MSSLNISRTSWLLLLVLMAGLTASLAYPPLEQIRDSLFWAMIIRDGNDLFSLYNPHHLIYLPVSRIIYLALSQICNGCSPIMAAQIHSVAWGLIAVAATFSVTCRLTGSSCLAVITALILIVSKTFWIYTMQVSPYVPMVGSLALLALAVVLLEENPASKSRFALLVSTYVLAVLYHQAAVLLILPIWIYLWLLYPVKTRIRNMMGAALLASVPVLILYLAAFVHIYGVGDIGFAALLKFAMRYASIPDPTFSTIANFSLDGLFSLLKYQSENFLLPPWPLRNVAVPAFGALLALMLIGHLIQAIRGRARAVRIFLLAWLTTMLLFYLWANPTEDAYLLINMPPLLLLGVWALRDINFFPARARGTMIACLAAVMALLGLTWWNLHVSILPMHESKGVYYEKARLTAEATPKSCTIVELNQLMLQNLGYYFERDSLDGWDLVSWFYFGKENTIPFTWEKFRFADHACIAIPARNLSPLLNVRTANGVKEPKLWFEYFSWLMALRPGDAEQTQTHCFEVSHAAGGVSMIILNTAKTCTHRTLAATFQDLDIATGEVDPGFGVHGFSDWFQQHKSVLPLPGQLGKHSHFPG
jgi:hypothetical protein